MKIFILFGTALVLFCSTSATPVAAPTVAKPAIHRPRLRPAPSPDEALALYSPRAKRLVQTYLRLRLLERREADLERIRAMIERRIGIDELLGETPMPRPR